MYWKIKKLFLKLFGFKYVKNRSTGEVHLIDCRYAQQVKHPKYMRAWQFEESIQHGCNGCVHCLYKYNDEHKIYYNHRHTRRL